MHARRHILDNHSYTHVFFRCHDRNFFFRNKEVKLFLIFLWATYKVKYGIKIYEFIIMDNHVHLLLKAPTPVHLGHFMRVVNSQIARYINMVFERDSQAIRERYKSPMVGDGKYYRQVIQYIWTNRYKVNKRNPLQDPFCSASWRYTSDIIDAISDNPKEASLFRSLLDDHDHILDEKGMALVRAVKELLYDAIERLKEFSEKIYNHGHTIADKGGVEFRVELLKALRKERVPWVDPLSKPYFETI